MTYEAPAVGKDAFTCPHCSAFAQMEWIQLFRHVDGPFGGEWRGVGEWGIARCAACKRDCVWNGRELRWPLVHTGPPPHEAMPDPIKALYIEASEVGSRSPKSAAALLRLALQHMLTDIAGENNINDAIAKLVRDGLRTRIQQAMDVLRVVGNNAVHPGEIQLDEQAETVTALFSLLNVVVDDRIAQPQQIEDLYEALPPAALAAIARRDDQR